MDRHESDIVEIGAGEVAAMIARLAAPVGMGVSPPLEAIKAILGVHYIALANAGYALVRTPEHPADKIAEAQHYVSDNDLLKPYRTEEG